MPKKNNEAREIRFSIPFNGAEKRLIERAAKILNEAPAVYARDVLKRLSRQVIKGAGQKVAEEPAAERWTCQCGTSGVTPEDHQKHMAEGCREFYPHGPLADEALAAVPALPIAPPEPAQAKSDDFRWPVDTEDDD